MANEQLEQEIASLEEILQEKRAELGGQDAEALQEFQERDKLHEEIGQQIQDYVASQGDDTQTSLPPMPPADGPDAVASQVQALVNVAFQKSIKEAIADAVRTNNAAIIDAFHDALVDELYTELVARKKVEQPA